VRSEGENGKVVGGGEWGGGDGGEEKGRKGWRNRLEE